VLALGDPAFAHPAAIPVRDESLPPGGLLVTQVVPEGNAAAARLRAGDVLLAYAGTDLARADQLPPLIETNAGARSVPVTVWREGKTAVRDVGPGKLGVVLAEDPAPAAVAARRAADRMVAALRSGRDWADLPGTRVEVNRVQALFGGGATVLAGAAASEPGLDALRKAGALKTFRYLHLATHGEVNDEKAFESALILAQDRAAPAPLPRAGEPFLDGRLTADEVIQFWALEAELVTLSACETALGREGGGDGLLGFAQAFLAAGSRSVCLSLWRVDDAATALLMDRFYRNLLGKREGLAGPMPKAEALAEAKRWLRDLSAGEALRLTAELSGGVARGKGAPGRELTVPAADPKGPAPGDHRPFAHPRYWAAFVFIGDPN
jgi:CHAT domain-containing protein